MEKEFEILLKKYFDVSFQKVVGKIISIGKVLDVDMNKDTCAISTPQGDIPNASLKSVQNDSISKIITYPVVGSYVMYVLVENKINEAIIVKVSEIQRIIIQIGEFKIDLNSEELLINEGKNGALIISESIVKKINAIENKLNDVIKKLKLVKIPLAPSGTYLLSADFGSVGTIENTKTSDIENTKIKH